MVLVIKSTRQQPPTRGRELLLAAMTHVAFMCSQVDILKQVCTDIAVGQRHLAATNCAVCPT